MVIILEGASLKVIIGASIFTLILIYFSNYSSYSYTTSVNLALNNSTQANNTSGNFTINLFFPPSSGIKNQSYNLPVNSCSRLYGCLNSIANVSCTFYQSDGVLSCANVTQTCFINSIDEVNAQDYGLGAFWKISQNNTMVPEGVSCLPLFKNANYSFKISNNFN